MKIIYLFLTLAIFHISQIKSCPQNKVSFQNKAFSISDAQGNFFVFHQPDDKFLITATYYTEYGEKIWSRNFKNITKDNYYSISGSLLPEGELSFCFKYQNQEFVEYEVRDPFLKILSKESIAVKKSEKCSQLFPVGPDSVIIILEDLDSMRIILIKNNIEANLPDELQNFPKDTTIKPIKNGFLVISPNNPVKFFDLLSFQIRVSAHVPTNQKFNVHIIEDGRNNKELYVDYSQPVTLKLFGNDGRDVIFEKSYNHFASYISIASTINQLTNVLVICASSHSNGRCISYDLQSGDKIDSEESIEGFENTQHINLVALSSSKFLLEWTNSNQYIALILGDSGNCNSLYSKLAVSCPQNCPNCIYSSEVIYCPSKFLIQRNQPAIYYSSNGRTLKNCKYGCLRCSSFEKCHECIFDAEIKFGNRTHPRNETLELNGDVFTNGPCSEILGLKFKWSCNRIAFDGITNRCDDPDNLFDAERDTGRLIVPTNYFLDAKILEIELFVFSYNFKSKAYTYIEFQNITGHSISLKCLNKNCMRINQHEEILIQTAYVSDKIIISSTKWSANMPIKLISYRNFLYLQFETFPQSLDSLRISTELQDEENAVKAYLELKFNEPPLNGSVHITPANGLEFETKFNLEARDWTDEDFPLSYQYFLQFNDFRIPISVRSIAYKTDMILPALNNQASLYVEIKDVYNTTSTKFIPVFVNEDEKTVEEKLQYLEARLNNIQVDEMIDFSLITAGIINIEEKIVQRQNLVKCFDCPDEDIDCIPSKCKCSSEKSEYDCGISIEDWNQLVRLKTLIIRNINFQSEYLDFDLSLPIVTLLLKNEKFVDLIFISEAVAIARSLMGTQSQNIARDIFIYIDTLLQSLSFIDCECKTGNCIEIEGLIHPLLQSSVNEILKFKIPKASNYIFQGRLFDAFVTKLYLCDFNSLTLQSSKNGSRISFKTSERESYDCLKQIEISIFAFRSDIFECKGDPGPKEKYIFNYGTVDASINLENILSIEISKSKEHYCPNKCSSIENKCTCRVKHLEHSLIFSEIFKPRASSDFVNIWAVGDIFWPSTYIFWTHLIVLIITLTSFMMLSFSKKLQRYSILKDAAEQARMSWIQGACCYIAMSYEELSAFMIISKNISKRSKLILIYFKILFNSLVAALSCEEYSQDRKLSQYILILNFSACIFIYIILKVIKFALHVKQFSRPNSGRCLQRIIILTLIFIIGIIVFALSFILIANKSKAADESWLLIFIITFLQSWVLYLPIENAFKFILMKNKNRMSASSSKLSKFLNLLFDVEDFTKIYKKIHFRNDIRRVTPSTIIDGSIPNLGTRTLELTQNYNNHTVSYINKTCQSTIRTLKQLDDQISTIPVIENEPETRKNLIIQKVETPKFNKFYTLQNEFQNFEEKFDFEIKKKFEEA